MSLSVFLLFVIVADAQAPAFINYQGVARNSVGNALVNKTIGLRLTIRDYGGGGPPGIPVYTETRTVTTNAFGLFNVQIGGAGGTNVTGTILGVNWKLGPKFLQVEIDTEGGTSYKDIGTTRLTSVPYALYANQAGDLVLPFIKSQNEEVPLFKITNTGNNINSLSYEGLSSSTANNAAAIRGIITSVSPGGFSAGVVGQNNGTGANGIGVYGNQNGTGWGVYGTTPGGVGVYGNSTSGMGVYGQSVTGPSIMGFQPSTGTSNAGYFQNFNQNNTAATLRVLTNGLGEGLNVTTTGFGRGAIITINNATNGTTVLEATTNGFGKVAFLQNTNTLNNNNVLEAQNSGIGRTGLLQNTNASNAANVLEVQTNGMGKVGVFQNTNAANTANALDVTTNGLSRVGYLENTNATNASNVLEVQTNGLGRVGVLQNTNAANAANALDVRTNGLGRVGFLQNTRATNTSNVLEVQTNGTGKVALFQNTNAASASNALHVMTNGTGYAAYLQNTNASPKALLTNGSVFINDATQSLDSVTGALVIRTGGLGVEGNLNVGGTATFSGAVTFKAPVSFTDGTESINPTTGAVIVTGGVGIGKRLNVQGDGRFYNALTVDGVTTLQNKLNANGQVTINANPGSGTDNLYANYPLQVQGSNQGIAIKINGSRSNSNNFISFWDDTKMWGRIEGETLTQLHNSEDYKVQKETLELARTMAAINVATGAVSVIMQTINLVGAATSSTGCAGLGFCVTVPVPSLIIAAVAQLAAAVANEIAVAIGLEAAIDQLNYFVTTKDNAIGVTYQSGSGDYAEWLPKSNQSEKFIPGYIVGVKNGKITLNTAGADKLFVISTRPIVLGNMPEQGKESDYEKVAFMGQVPVHILGKVNAGDYILPSGYNNGLGKAVSPEKMKPEDYVNIVGMAWSSSTNDSYSIINVAIGLNTGDVSKLVSEQNKEINDLKGQINETNTILARLVPGFKEAAGLKEPIVIKKPVISDNHNPVEIVKLNTSNIVYFDLTNEQVSKGLDMAQQFFIEKGGNINTHPFWKKINNDPGYKEIVMNEIKKVFREKMHMHKDIDSQVLDHK